MGWNFTSEKPAKFSNQYHGKISESEKYNVTLCSWSAAPDWSANWLKVKKKKICYIRPFTLHVIQACDREHSPTHKNVQNRRAGQKLKKN